MVEDEHVEVNPIDPYKRMIIASRSFLRDSFSAKKLPPAILNTLLVAAAATPPQQASWRSTTSNSQNTLFGLEGYPLPAELIQDHPTGLSLVTFAPRSPFSGVCSVHGLFRDTFHQHLEQEFEKFLSKDAELWRFSEESQQFRQILANRQRQFLWGFADNVLRHTAAAREAHHHLLRKVLEQS